MGNKTSTNTNTLTLDNKFPRKKRNKRRNKKNAPLLITGNTGSSGRTKIPTGERLDAKKEGITEFLDQDTVKLKVTKSDKSDKNNKNGYYVSVITYSAYYNRRYFFAGDISTLYDFLQRWEHDFGVDSLKSGWSSDWTQNKLSSSITQGIKQFNITLDTKLKDLINQDMEWYSFKPGYEKNKVTSVDFNQSNKSKGEVFDFNSNVVIDLSILFDNSKRKQKAKKREVEKMEYCLSNRGWFLLQFPKEYHSKIKNSSEEILQNLNKYFDYENDKKTNENENETKNNWKTICNSFGFSNFKDYKSVLRIFTKDLYDLFESDYPNDINNSIKIISDIMDDITLKLIKNTSNLWKSNDNKLFDNVCLYNNNLSFGMIDFVLYKNNKELNDKKYNMLENDNMNVKSHIDPGLFSISFIQNNIGLQMFDKISKQWIEIPIYNDGKYGVLWTGQYSTIVSNYKINTGIHRVSYNDKKPRFTGWYEACINTQVSKQVLDEANNRKSENGE